MAAALALTACPDLDDTAADTEGTTGTGTGDETMGPGPGTTETPDDTDDESDGLDETTGDDGPMGEALEPCDPADPEPCDTGVCAGTGYGGFYCRPGCSNMAEPGSPCGADDVCLPDGHSDALACFDIQACDFVSGEGCPDALTCAVVSLDPLHTGCVPATGGALGSMCGPAGALACDPGLGCLGTDLEGDDPGGCQQWCVPGDPLPDGCALCIEATAEIGTCAECSALDQDCPAGQGCQPINELFGGVCIDHGPGVPGDPCDPFDAAMGCQEGSICFETDLDDVFACVAMCEPADPMCPGPDDACIDVGVFARGVPTGELGVCIEGTGLCDPSADPTGCPRGEACLAFEPDLGVCGATCDPPTGEAACDGNAACLPTEDGGALNFEPFFEGNGACGVACTGDGDCGGGTCLLVDGIDADGVCGITCTPGDGGCGMGETCVATPADPGVGACVVGGMACDDAMQGDCAGDACVVLDGGASAVCMPSCFEQNPLACGGAADQCHVKTDPRWHVGICLDAGAPCDVVAQDCGPDMRCEPIGGGAIGGVAFGCGEAGPVAVGGDCSAADCGEGLVCLGDVCREPCDPAAPACGAGACQDVSAQFYLPADSFGACL